MDAFGVVLFVVLVAIIAFMLWCYFMPDKCPLCNKKTCLCPPNAPEGYNMSPSAYKKIGAAYSEVGGSPAALASMSKRMPAMRSRLKNLKQYYEAKYKPNEKRTLKGPRGGIAYLDGDDYPYPIIRQQSGADSGFHGKPFIDNPRTVLGGVI